MNNDNLIVNSQSIAVTTDKKYQVTWLVRRLFRAMGARADRYLRASGLTAADRAVMEFLYPAEKLSVPAIASRYQVSRQHVQVTANELKERGLLRFEDNPQHKRSALLRLSHLGRRNFEAIRKNESQDVDQLLAGVTDGELETTRRTLEIMLKNLGWEKQ